MSDTENIDEKDSNSRVYELGFLLVPTISTDEMPVVFGDLKGLILTMGAEMISDEMPKMITLAYAMQKTIANIRNKFNTAYFGWVKFAMDADKVLDLKKKLDLDSQVVRFLILKTVRENTMASKRYIRTDMPSGTRAPLTKKTEDEVMVPINKEEVDKEIDAMVAA